VCALYVPGVAFSDVDKLCGVTLFEMSYTKWGAKVETSFHLSVCTCVALYNTQCTVLVDMNQQ